MKLCKWAVALPIAFILAAPYAFAAPRTLELAPNVMVSVPEVEPFRSIDEIPLLRDYAIRFTPSINLYLAGYIGEEDMKAWRTGSPETWRKWAFVQTFRNTIGQQLEADQLDSLYKELSEIALDPAKAKEISAYVEKDLKENRAQLNKKLAEEFSQRQTSNLITDVARVDGSIVKFSMLATVEQEVEADKPAPEPKTICCGGAAFLLKGRMTYVYVYSDLASKADVEWVDAKAVEWAKLILAANK